MKIPNEDFSDVTLIIGDTYVDDVRGGGGWEKTNLSVCDVLK